MPAPPFGFDADGRLVNAGHVLSAPGKVQSLDGGPYPYTNPFMAVVRSYLKEQNKLLLAVENSQYSAAVAIRDRRQSTNWIFEDPFFNKVRFQAIVAHLEPPALGFIYPYPFLMTIFVTSEVTPV